MRAGMHRIASVDLPRSLPQPDATLPLCLSSSNGRHFFLVYFFTWLLFCQSRSSFLVSSCADARASFCIVMSPFGSSHVFIAPVTHDCSVVARSCLRPPTSLSCSVDVFARQMLLVKLIDSVRFSPPWSWHNVRSM